MNGRAYDYNLGRFLSVDPFIQAPGNSQSMNPYSYIMNNPLAGTDPSGYTTVWDRDECESRGGSCDIEVAGVLGQLGFKVINGKVNLESYTPVRKELESLMTERSDEIYNFAKFKNKRNFGSRSISGGTFFRVTIGENRDISVSFIHSSGINNGETVFTNGIVNEIDGAVFNGRDHIYQVDGEYSSFVLFYNLTYGILSDLNEAFDDIDAFESGDGYTTLAIQLGSVMSGLDAKGFGTRFIGHSQGGAITAASARFAYESSGKLNNVRIALHGAPINNSFAASSFNKFGLANGSYHFRAQHNDPVHLIGGGNGTFGQRFNSVFQFFNLFRDRTHSPHSLPCAPDPAKVCNN